MRAPAASFTYARGSSTLPLIPSMLCRRFPEATVDPVQWTVSRVVKSITALINV